LKAPFPIEVTVSGIVIFFKDKQLLKQFFPIDIIELEK
jgi:hypothetical protein